MPTKKSKSWPLVLAAAAILVIGLATTGKIARAIALSIARDQFGVIGPAITGKIARGHAQQNPQRLPDLVSGLKAVPGCLGVETARTASGKNVIFAWFEDKKAVLRWYYSDMHQGAMKMLLADRKPDPPLQGVPDDIGPVLVIASLTMSEKPQFEGVSMPISQISIELYKPVTGGIFLGSRFAPASLKVAGMKDYTPRKEK